MFHIVKPALDLIKIVRANMKSTQVQQTRVSKKLHMESASSRMEDSELPPISFETVAKIEKEILFKNKLIINGSINTTIEMIAITPQEFFMIDKLAVTVLKLSFTLEPTTGTKLLIANLAVLMDKESTLCESVFLYDKTNMKIDITKIVTEIKVVLTVFDIPLKSHSFPMDFTQQKARHIFTRGSI